MKYKIKFLTGIFQKAGNDYAEAEVELTPVDDCPAYECAISIDNQTGMILRTKVEDLGKKIIVHIYKDDRPASEVKCEYCGGDKAIRNPTGKCDHLYYPDNVNKSLNPSCPASECDGSECTCGKLDNGAVVKERL